MGKKKATGWLKQILAAKEEVSGPAQEVTKILYEALLQLPEFRLADGTIAQVEDLYPPEVNDAGEIQCGIDVRLSNGSLLEFTLKNTGWERALTQEDIPGRRHRER